MLNAYPKLERGKIQEYGKTLPKKELEEIERFITRRKGRGLKDEDDLKTISRILFQVRYILNKPIREINSEELDKLLSIINNSDMQESYRNIVKAYLKSFLKFLFPDWSIRLSNLEDIKSSGNGHNEERINYKTLPKKEEIDSLIKSEPRIFWKAFLLVQYEGGLRTIEARNIKWNDIKLDVEDGLSEINIFSTKTKRARTVYVKEATHYLKLLKKEQENLNDKGIFIFHAKRDKDKPVEKYSVNFWFSKLTKRVLGRECWNYLLRHARATELYTLAEQNKISKDTAIRFMGHSDDMSKVYKHPNPADIKKMLREQVYNIEELPPEKKHELELENEKLKNRVERLEKDMKKLFNIAKRKIK